MLDRRPRRRALARRRRFYGWVIVAIAFACLAISYGFWNSFPVFYVAILAEFGWSRAETVLAASIFAGVYAFASPLTGAAIDRLGPRLVMPLGAVLLAAGMLATSRATELWHLYLFYGVLAAFGVSAVGTIANVTVLAKWFARRRGAAIGIATSGIGVGALVLVPLMQYIIGTAGWRTAYVALGLLVLATIPALTIAFQRRRPEDAGFLPDGDLPTKDQVAVPIGQRPMVVDENWARRSWTVRTAARTRRFWALFATLVLAATCHQSLMIHIVSYLDTRSLDPMLGASVVGLVGAATSVGKIGWGWMSDRIGREAVFTVGMLGVVCAVLLLMAVDRARVWPVYGYAVCFGLGFGAFAPAASAAAADLFQGRRFGAILGAIWVGSGIGASLGPWVAGYLFDLTGAYALSQALAMLAALLAIVGMWSAAPRKVRAVPGVAARGRMISLNTEPGSRE